MKINKVDNDIRNEFQKEANIDFYSLIKLNEVLEKYPDFNNTDFMMITETEEIVFQLIIDEMKDLLEREYFYIDFGGFSVEDLEDEINYLTKEYKNKREEHIYDYIVNKGIYYIYILENGKIIRMIK